MHYTGLATRPPGHLYVSFVSQFAASSRGDLSREVRHRYWWRWRRRCGCRRRSGSGRGDTGNRRRHRHVDVPRWRSGRIPDCICRRDQPHLWMVPRNIVRKYNLSCLRVQQFVTIVPVIVAEVKKITQAGTGITLVLSRHSVMGRLEKWQQRQRRAGPIKYLMGGKSYVICRAS